ncbi:hypothetical protein, partial [Cypionkella sp.]|uniref:hypothetical protein n=1 Tax=Cypionkella sp. TaxID=2811411 RepID=UPI002FDDD08F
SAMIANQAPSQKRQSKKQNQFHAAPLTKATACCQNARQALGSDVDEPILFSQEKVNIGHNL